GVGPVRRQEAGPGAGFALEKPQVWQKKRQPQVAKRFSPFIMESIFFLARYFSIVPCGPLSMRVWWPFQKNRTCIPFFGSGYAGLGMKSRLRTGGTSECAVIQALTQFLIG